MRNQSHFPVQEVSLAPYCFHNETQTPQLGTKWYYRSPSQEKSGKDIANDGGKLKTGAKE